MTAYEIAESLHFLLWKGGTVDHRGRVGWFNTGYYVGGKYEPLVFSSAEDVDRGEIAWWAGTHVSRFYRVETLGSKGAVRIDALTHMQYREHAANLAAIRGQSIYWLAATGEEISAPVGSSVAGFHVGDYVVTAERDATFKVTAFERDEDGNSLIQVVRIDDPTDAVFAFRPDELLLEDGSRPI